MVELGDNADATESQLKVPEAKLNRGLLDGWRSAMPELDYEGEKGCSRLQSSVRLRRCNPYMLTQYVYQATLWRSPLVRSQPSQKGYLQRMLSCRLVVLWHLSSRNAGPQVLESKPSTTFWAALARSLEKQTRDGVKSKASPESTRKYFYGFDLPTNVRFLVSKASEPLPRFLLKNGGAYRYCKYPGATKVRTHL
jgi:hypothetical protein